PHREEPQPATFSKQLRGVAVKGFHGGTFNPLRAAFVLPPGSMEPEKLGEGLAQVAGRARTFNSKTRLLLEPSQPPSIVVGPGRALHEFREGFAFETFEEALVSRALRDRISPRAELLGQERHALCVGREVGKVQHVPFAFPLVKHFSETRHY